MDPPNEDNSTPPTVLLHCRIDRLRVMYPIGKSYNGSIQVHKAVCTAEDIDTCGNFLTQNENFPIQDIFVAVKYVNIADDAVIHNLRVDVERSRSLPYHRNLIGVRKPFHYNRYYCVIFPLMELGSLRSIMAARFPNGLPEECIVVVLKETLNGLSFIHRNGLIHREINAGHIFLNGKPEIRLAFSASIYDEHQDQPSQYVPVGSICKWAAAPEVHKHGNRFIGDKSDIWMVGITALELAYGGLRVFDRDDLEKMLRMIQTTKELPSDWRDKKEGGINMFTSFLFKKRSFSKAFQNMVVKCLSREPNWRPNVQELLEYDVFTKCNKDVYWFNNLLRNN
ncbi:hypothetical protein BUALT_Bualt01G0218900 [Buddleja alternifolia]|uniref:Protein kinase domain-containing protein n=1 Tax=Buddleja alternifolia TaxID=168488 RepID=A0AAV6YG09_9LAMI|nr:hypothetical protein BUALT_Bualt01G0218900 [Buddleja alternifolia]